MSSGIRMSGMISGMDTEALVQAMVSNQIAKKEKYQKAQTKLEWKQDAFKSINTKVYGLYGKISNFRFSSAYNMKKTTVSDSTKATITASGTAVNGTQTLEVRQLAKSGYLTGGKLQSGTTENTTLQELGYTGGDTSITLRTGTGYKEISINQDTKISDLVNKLKEAGVNANYDAGNGRFFVSAKETGTANDFSLTASSLSGLQALAAAGLSVNSEANLATYRTNATYALGTMGVDGSGNVVSYFELDDKGNIIYEEDSQGNQVAKVRQGVTYSPEATRQRIAEMMNELSSAYQTIDSKKAQNQELQQKINYSKAKDAVTEFEAQGADGKQLVELLQLSAPKYKYVDENGKVYNNYEIENGKHVYFNKDENGNRIDVVESDKAFDNAQERIDKISEDMGLVTKTTKEDGTEEVNKEKLTQLQNNIQKMLSIDGNAALSDEAKASYYLDETERTAAETTIADNNTLITEKNDYIKANAHWDIKDYSAYYDDPTKMDGLVDSIVNEISMARDIVEGRTQIPFSQGASRVDAQDAVILLNGAEFTSDTNSFEINGLSIKATGVTEAGNPLTITTDTDSQGLYDKIKELLREYNEVINELTSVYNADSAKGYEPLTEDQKEEMSESEIEKWETKIKDSILRRDSTIGGVMNAMTSAMSKVYEINGKSYSLGSFGISTTGYLNSAKNQQYAYHIDGDAEDSATSGKTDKLMNMINNEPEVVEEFMKQLSTGLYKALDEKMKSTTMSSAYTIYSDKKMTKEQDEYKKLIKTWEEKIKDMEDRYYKQFANMEKQLSNMQSATSSLSGLLGGQ